MIDQLRVLLEDVFGGLLNASWQASVLALLVAILQWALGARLNPRWRYALWLLVLGRLLLPVQPESALSLFRFTSEPPAAFVAPITEPLFAPAPLAAPVPAIAMVTTGDGMAFSFYSALALVWLAGALILFVLTWRVNRLFARQMARSPEVGDPVLLALFEASKIELNIRRSIRLVESGQVQSPAITGLFHPTLLLPVRVREKFDETELRLIFLHELAHLKRGDVMVQALIALLQILHWFNPVLWLAFRRMRLDRESATDALVLSRTGEAEKERHGLMLIKLLEHFNQRHSLPTLVGILEDKDQFKRRFSLIARFTRGAYGWSLLGVLLIGILSVACLTKSKVDGNAAIVSGTTGSSKASSKDMIRIGTKVIQISEEDYQAHRDEIDAATKRGDVEPLSHLKSFDLISEPAVLILSGERGVMEAVRVFPYATQFRKEKNGKMTPTDFARKDIGVRFPLVATVEGGKVSLQGELELSALQSWVRLDQGNDRPIFQDGDVRLPVSLSLDSGEAVGLQTQGIQMLMPQGKVPDLEALFGPEDKTVKQPPQRLFLFLNVKMEPVVRGSTAENIPSRVIDPEYPGARPPGFGATSATQTSPPPNSPGNGLSASTPFYSTPATDGNLDTSGKKPAVNITIRLCEINQKDYGQQAQAMDEAVREGNFSFFKGRLTRETSLYLLVGQNGWYSEGEVQSYIASVKKENDGGIIRTALQGKAIFYGLNADFKWSGNGHVDSTWQVSIPLGFDKMVVSPDIPTSAYPAGLRVPRVLVTHFADKDWDPASGKARGFWVGETQGWIKTGPTGPLEERIKRETPSRLAVFLTAQPVVASDTKPATAGLASSNPMQGAPPTTVVVNAPVGVDPGVPQKISDQSSTLDPANAAQVRVSVVITGKNLKDWPHLKFSGSQMNAPSVSRIDLGTTTIPGGGTGSVASVYKFPYPTDFDPAERVQQNDAANNKMTLVVPITPREFVTTPVGWSVALQPSVEKGQIHLQGTATYTDVQWMPGGVYGDQSGPIYADVKDAQTGKTSHVLVSANSANMPAFRKSDTPFFVFCQPGRDYTVRLPYGSDWVEATIHCDLVPAADMVNPLGDAVAGISAPNPIQNANTLLNNESIVAPGAGILGSIKEPGQAGESLTVRAFLAPPHFFHGPGTDATPTTPSDKSTTTERVNALALEELSARGVQFPSGSTVTLLPGSGKLVVRDTPEQLDLIAHLIEEQVKNEPAPPPTPAPNAIQKANALLDHDYLLPPSVKGPGVEIVGKLKEPGQVDFSRSSGLLLSVDGLGYKFGFAADGSFTIPHVQPGVYNRSLKLVSKSDSVIWPVSSSPSLEPIEVEAGAAHLTMNMAMDTPFDLPLPAGQVEINLKVATVDEDDYDAHRELFDEAMKKGGPDLVRLLLNRKSVDLISTPSVTTNDGKRAHIDIVREFPYPTSFTTDKNGKVTPDTFTTADVGIKSDVIAKRENGKIQLNCALTITDFDGFTDSNMGVKLPTFHTVESHVVEEMASGELKGVWIPGNLFNKQTIHTNGTPASSDVHRITSQRILLFLSARDT